MIENVQDFLIKELKGKEILFIEGDIFLTNSVEKLANFFIENQIGYNTILNAGEMSLKGIQEMVNNYDVIIWESQYVTETADNIMGLLFSDKLTRWEAQGANVPKILIECAIGDPLYYYKPDTKKRFWYMTSISRSSGREWKLYEIEKEKPYWSKKDNEL